MKYAVVFLFFHTNLAYPDFIPELKNIHRKFNPNLIEYQNSYFQCSHLKFGFYSTHVNFDFTLQLSSGSIFGRTQKSGMRTETIPGFAQWCEIKQLENRKRIARFYYSAGYYSIVNFRIATYKPIGKKSVFGPFFKPINSYPNIPGDIQKCFVPYIGFQFTIPLYKVPKNRIFLPLLKDIYESDRPKTAPNRVRKPIYLPLSCDYAW
ncbi:MAG: hypothetical protein KG003_08240 [Bacteroidetes bacterium]|nr:hypothetical protein [Bacteroidota bacterium]